MTEYSFTMTDPLGVPIHVYEWLPEAEGPVRGILQISHGMSETAARYARFAERLNAAGYAVYAGDHRGHGKTAGRIDLLGDAGQDGFYWMHRNLLQIAAIASGRHPGIPVFLLGHSMGSFLAQKLMCSPGSERYAGYILSGSNGPRGMLRLGETLAKAQLALMGERHRSMLLNGIVFGPYNRSFSNSRTAFDWLSSDPEEVDRFVDDPFCGAICTTRFFRDFFRLLQDIHTEAVLGSLCKDKPVYLFSGEKDPVGMNGQGILRLAELYGKCGVSDLEVKLYPDGRHEMLNEKNHGQVTDDLLDWLVRHLPPGQDLLRTQ
ncbi:alpha/beta fold hydrolase [Paenibacillus durus]|uniref:alpha/beta fold hydrolase n=1 Tax=Paenibacillus durus TaxID=44251 RepID=UPI000AB50F4B|nr:alpha/beta hydrolase [Paenibacillus durus]